MSADMTEQLGEPRFKVHPGQTSRRAATTYWVRDKLNPKWPEGPYRTREEAGIACAARCKAAAVLAAVAAQPASPIPGYGEREAGDVNQNPGTKD